MLRRYRILAVCLFAVLAVWALAKAAPHGEGSGLTTVIIVRHAERGPDEGLQSPITDKGRERAAELARVLKGAGVTKVLVSEYVRTRQTIEPFASAAKIEPEAVPVQRGVDALAARIRELRGETILVSSHRGRLEPLIEKLGGGKIPGLGEAEYDNLFVLTIPESGTPKLVTFKYGTP